MASSVVVMVQASCIKALLLCFLYKAASTTHFGCYGFQQSSLSPMAVSYWESLRTSSPSAYDSSFVTAHGSISGANVASKKETSSFESLSLQGFIRGHKCLLDDSVVANGNVALLLRGADTSQRMLYPLEIQTNKLFLGGSEAAIAMFQFGQEAIKYSQNAVFKEYPNLAGRESIVGSTIAEDTPRYHRVLQYAVAAGLSHSFLRPAALAFIMELYDEIGMNYDAMGLAIQSFKQYYSDKISKAQFNDFFMPSWNHLYSVISDMRNRISSTSTPLKHVRNFEKPPEEGTLHPLLVDLKTIDLAEFHEEDRKSVEELVKKFKL